MNKIKLLKFLIFSILLFFISSQAVYAQLGSSTEPARLRELEPLAVQLVYVFWAFGGIIFTVILMWIGFLYMTSAGDQQKKQELMGRGKNWLIGLVVFFAGYPIIYTVYDVLGVGDNNPECYSEIATPGFHFFFPNVCTDPQASSRYFAGATLDGVDLTDEDTIKALIDNGLCRLPLWGGDNDNILIPVDTRIYSVRNDNIYVYSIVEANGTCQSKTTLGRTSTQEYEYRLTLEADSSNLEKISGKIFAYGDVCTNKDVADSGDRGVCCHFTGRAVPAQENSGVTGSTKYVRFTRPDNNTAVITYYWYDDTGNDEGSCDCPGGSSQGISCDNLPTETPVYTVPSG